MPVGEGCSIAQRVAGGEGRQLEITVRCLLLGAGASLGPGWVPGHLRPCVPAVC